MNTEELWPALPYAEWAPTKKTLQMCAQMLGKARVALSPPQPEWLHTALYLDGRGFTTGAMPFGEGLVASTGELWRRQRKLMSPFFTLLFKAALSGEAAERQ